MSNRLTKSEINTLKSARIVQIQNVIDNQTRVAGFGIMVDGVRLLSPIYWTQGAINRSIKRIRPDLDISFYVGV